MGALHGCWQPLAGVGGNKGLFLCPGPLKYLYRAITWEEQCLVEAPDRCSLQHYGSLSTKNS